ncbi:MAG TPA: hypothetical protein VIL00_11730 [Pseudonocardiaceae bacterium]
MVYRWRYEDAEGREVPGPDTEFPDQAEAEDWLARNYQDLLDGGIEQVVLLENRTELYGPMSLHPAE